MKAGTEFVIKVYRVLLLFGILLFYFVVLKVIYQEYMHNSYSIKPTDKIIHIGDTNGKNKSIFNQWEFCVHESCKI